MGTFITSFHNSRTTTGDDSITVIYYFFGNLLGEFVVFHIGFGTGRTKYGHTRSNLTQFFVTTYKFAHDLKDRPAIVCFYLVPGFSSLFRYHSLNLYFNSFLRNLAVWLFLFLATSSGVPVMMTSPPPLPPSGPISII